MGLYSAIVCSRSMRDFSLQLCRPFNIERAGFIVDQYGTLVYNSL